MFTKKEIELVKAQFGDFNPKFMLGVVKHTNINPLDNLCVDNGKVHSDVSLILQAKARKFDASVVALLDSRFTSRGESVSSDSVVGSRHQTLSQAFNAAKAAESDFKEALVNARKPAEPAPAEPAPAEPVPAAS